MAKDESKKEAVKTNVKENIKTNAKDEIKTNTEEEIKRDVKEGIRTNIPEPFNECCKSCLKWNAYGEKCYVHWHGKKECSQKVKTHDEWEYEKLLMR